MTLDDQGNTGNGAGMWIVGSGNNSAYVKIQGVFFKSAVFLSYVSHWYLKQCAVQGDADGNNATVGSDNTNYVVFEDLLAFGKGRYKFLWYDVNRGGYNFNAVCRRCIARQDWVNDASDPMGTFVSYFAQNVALLNVIDIDGNLPAKWSASQVCGSFCEQMEAAPVNYTIQGSMSINNAQPMAMPTQQSSNINFTDVAGVNVAGGFDLYNSSGETLNRITLANINKNNFSGYTISDSAFAQENSGFGGGGTATITNAIVRGAANQAATNSYGGDYFNYYNCANGSTFKPAHTYTTDPYANGLLYPVRIESGSALATAGSGGGQIGANITQALGPDGAEYGASGWNAPQGNLWPWPLEAWAKAQMAAMNTTITGSTMPSPARGFCASGNGLYGGPITLTSYIWESLGHALPSSVYGGGTLVPPTNLHAQ